MKNKNNQLRGNWPQAYVHKTDFAVVSTGIEPASFIYIAQFDQEGVMLNQDQIKGKWDEIKGGVRNLWGEITDDELEQTKGNITAVSGIVQQKYGESKEVIKEKLDRLMDSFDNETDKSLKINDGESSYQRNPTAVRTSETSQVQDEFSDINTRSPERSRFENSPSAASNTKQGIAGNRDNKSQIGGYSAGLAAGTGAADQQDATLHDVDDVDFAGESGDEYDTDEIFEEDTGKNAEDRIARH